ncbi:threonine ammonia-lyase [Magnetospirillum sulfuroxidans]|uniref:Threonine ammonia-lyase n=1 Tax=Magnetospirillum sulfuroxidans TaxID=611300 RepID=A0ABS5I8P3_9PROT|nr:threonine ammonia-lyase [Magnetospirillum sulfuroxidans]MBR9970527.1 threonine ammonia-lyase [Magnetospirillum sulfuroxidans]
MNPDLRQVQAAAAAIADHVAVTPVIQSPQLALRTGAAQVFLKLENLQHSGSFKARGALNRILALSPAERKAGVIAMSAGNHAQGVALHCGRLGIPATVVMPLFTPVTKVQRTAAFGANVIQAGETLAEAEQHAHVLAAERGLTFIHPYDDSRVIAGQGSVGLELARQQPDLDDVIIPIGGGGLAAGMALALSAEPSPPRLTGVQSVSFPTLVRYDHDGPPSPAQTLAEGIAVKHPGSRTKPIIDRLFDDVLAVDDLAIEQAIVWLMEEQKIVAEGAGAAPLALLLSRPERFHDRRVALVISGGNIDNRVMASILMRGLVRAGRLARLRIEISDAPGMLAHATALIAEHGGNILEVHHQRLFQDVPVKSAELDVVVEATDSGHVEAMLTALRQAGYPARKLGSAASLPE